MRRSGLMRMAVLVIVALPGCAAVTTGSLLNEMADLRRLAELPSPAYTTRQFSSYDRKSTTPNDPETWFANGDSNQFIRVEKNAGRDEWVMMDADGPGAIVRIWSANPKGTLRIYLDDNQAPAIESPMSDLLGGKVAEFPEPIAGECSRGWNLYFPIPYARHCKVTSDDKGFYYHVDYRTYPKGTRVVTFTRQELKELAVRVGQVAGQLRSPKTAADPSMLADKRPIDAVLAPGAEATLVELAGPRAICALQCRITAADLTAAARGVVLYMSFDDERTVECPLGDFFGTAPGLAGYESLPMGIVCDDKSPSENPKDATGKRQVPHGCETGSNPVMWCHWFMPFARQAKIAVKNFGSQDVKILGGVAAVPYEWTGRSLLFHAKWRIQRDLPSRPLSDWTHLQCRGQGRFVGGALYLCNPVKGWWGEGDEKIYVDGETFPSFFGTGTEDYYGYAWSSSELFMHAYHAQTRCDGPQNFGYTSVSRFHVLDDVPFASQFKFDIENWHSNKVTKTDRAAVSCWYARPGGTDFFERISAADVAPPRPMVYQVQYVAGAIEGEKMREITVPGNCRVEGRSDQLSGEEQLLWEKGKPGDKLVLGFPVAEAGRRHVIVRLGKDKGYGRVQLYVNDAKAGDAIDLYGRKYKPADEIDLGEFDVQGGENRLTVEIVGVNEQAAKDYEFAIDYLKLK